MTTPRVVDSTGGGVVELRRYTLHPGRRDELIGLFEREFLHTQRDAGIDVIGQFRDVDHPDTFTWLRGFPDMEARRRSLAEFYGDPVWARHRDAANATMIDSDDVLLLTNIGPPNRSMQAPMPERTTRRFEIVTFHLAEDLNPAEVADLNGSLNNLGGWTLELFARTLPAVNTFPALPVRSDANVVVAVLSAATTSLPPATRWNVIGSQRPSITNTEVVRLVPIERSLLH
jgi:hypothetical protein